MASRRPSEDANGELTNVGITLGKVIGGGSFAKVSSAKQIVNGQEHKRAVKIMNLDKINDPRFESTFLARELEILRIVNHKHIVKVHGVIESGRFVYVITDLYACDLLQYIQQRGVLTESVARRVIRELCQAVIYLHDELDVAHRDLKTENLFLSYHGRLILGDFGFARKVGGELSGTRCGSDGYIAPEVAASTRQIDAKLGDVWSVGVILFSVVTKSLPFDKREYKIMNKYKRVKIRYPPNCEISDCLKDLLMKIMRFPPAERLPLADFSKHAWFRDNRDVTPDTI